MSSCGWPMVASCLFVPGTFSVKNGAFVVHSDPRQTHFTRSPQIAPVDCQFFGGRRIDFFAVTIDNYVCAISIDSPSGGGIVYAMHKAYANGIYAGRSVGGCHHHWDSCCPSVACGAGGPRSGPACDVQQQFEADRLGLAQLRSGKRRIPPRRHLWVQLHRFGPLRRYLVRGGPSGFAQSRDQLSAPHPAIHGERQSGGGVELFGGHLLYRPESRHGAEQRYDRSTRHCRVLLSEPAVQSPPGIEHGARRPVVPVGRVDGRRDRLRRVRRPAWRLGCRTLFSGLPGVRHVGAERPLHSPPARRPPTMARHTLPATARRRQDDGGFSASRTSPPPPPISRTASPVR